MEKENLEEIKRKMLEIYNMNEKDGKNNVDKITYYNQIVFKSNESKADYAITDVYAVFLKFDKEIDKNKIILYQEGKEIATIDENFIINFNEEFLEENKKLNPVIYKILQEVNGKKFELPEIEKEDEKTPNVNKEKTTDFEMNKTELEKMNQEKKKEKKIKEEEEKPKNEEESIKKIAEKSGISVEDIKSCSTIKPEERVTEKQSFEEIANVKGKYSNVFVVALNSQTKGNSRFAFWGITPEGKAEQIEGLEERDGASTGKSIYSINRDGSEVKEEQTAALFSMPGGKEGFSVTIGQYGIVETEYIRRSPENNKFIGNKINSSTQKPTTKEVEEFMDKNRTTDRELGDIVNRTKRQLEETNKTNIKNIDNNLSNDVALDLDQEIEVNNEIITLAKEAENLGLSIEEYKKEYEEMIGDTPSEKIKNIRIKYQVKEQEKSAYEEMDRGERLTPEEEALRRRGL